MASNERANTTHRDKTMALPKINGLARIEKITDLDHPAPGMRVRLNVLGNGRSVTWTANTITKSTAMDVAPICEGDVIELQASVSGDALRRVRYSNNGQQFRGVAWHDRQYKLQSN